MSERDTPIVAVKAISREKVNITPQLSVELSLELPPSPAPDGNELAILLHPWSLLGGNMNDPILRYFLDMLHIRGFYVILYNSRGIGKSSGWPSFTGLQEGKDLRDVVRWGLSYIPNVQHVLIVGYSYGALIASQHPVLPEPIKTSHILVSYPLDKRGLLTLFHSQTHAELLKSLVQDSRSNFLLLFGDRDEFTGIGSYEAWVAQLQRNAGLEGRGTDGRVQVGFVKGATHFWQERQAETMRRIVEQWLDRSPHLPARIMSQCEGF